MKSGLQQGQGRSGNKHGNQWARLERDRTDQKNAGLKVVTLIATLNPVSQVLW
jgi:hypothetical protein